MNYCERCNKVADSLKMIGVIDETNKKKLMWICLECYEEHTWEMPDDRNEQVTTPSQTVGKSRKGVKQDS